MSSSSQTLVKTRHVIHLVVSRPFLLNSGCWASKAAIGVMLVGMTERTENQWDKNWAALYPNMSDFAAWWVDDTLMCMLDFLLLKVESFSFQNHLPGIFQEGRTGLSKMNCLSPKWHLLSPSCKEWAVAYKEQREERCFYFHLFPLVLALLWYL